MRVTLSQITLTAFLAVTACTGAGNYTSEYQLMDVEKLRRAEAIGSPFTQALTKEYRDFAIREQDEMYDYPDALHYARKGLMAAKGIVVTPEPVSDWHLNSDQSIELTNARSQLMRFLDVGARELHPSVAATAQANFDCWIEQLEENWQEEDIYACRTRFMMAMNDLKKAMDAGAIPSDIIAQRTPLPLPVEKMPPIVAEVAVVEIEATPDEDLPEFAQKPLTAENARFLTFFDFDSSTIDETADEVLKAVAQEVKDNSALTSMHIVGHADRSGPQSYNQALGLRRAKAVRQKLVEYGVKADSITVSSKGETDPLVQTADGVREPANRRAVITFASPSENETSQTD